MLISGTDTGPTKDFGSELVDVCHVSTRNMAAPHAHTVHRVRSIYVTKGGVHCSTLIDTFNRSARCSGAVGLCYDSFALHWNGVPG
jgi:hypothetical protein